MHLPSRYVFHSKAPLSAAAEKLGTTSFFRSSCTIPEMALVAQGCKVRIRASWRRGLDKFRVFAARDVLYEAWWSRGECLDVASLADFLELHRWYFYPWTHILVLCSIERIFFFLTNTSTNLHVVFLRVGNSLEFFW